MCLVSRSILYLWVFLDEAMSSVQFQIVTAASTHKTSQKSQDLWTETLRQEQRYTEKPCIPLYYYYGTRRGSREQDAKYQEIYQEHPRLWDHLRTTQHTYSSYPHKGITIKFRGTSDTRKFECPHESLGYIIMSATITDVETLPSSNLSAL
jgi:hypothetical protein